MIQSPTYIHFRVQWQMIGPDSPGQRYERKEFQKLFNKLNGPSIDADFNDFSYKPNVCEMSKLREATHHEGQSFSKLAYSNGRLTIVEEWAELTADEFEDKSIKILQAWFEIFPQSIAVYQDCVIRALIEPVHYKDSRVFLGDHVSGLGPAMQSSFRQMPFKIGFNASVERPIDEESKIFIDTLVNSWRDNRNVWVEVNGKTMLPKPINATSHHKAKYPFKTCRDFLEKEVVDLLRQFDKDKKGDSEEKRQGAEE